MADSLEKVSTVYAPGVANMELSGRALDRDGNEDRAPAFYDKAPRRKKGTAWQTNLRVSGCGCATG